MDQQLVQLVKEINQIEYETNLMLTEEFASLIDDKITAKQAKFLDLLRKRGALQTHELSILMGTSASAVSQLINRLEQDGYIKRIVNLKDRREILVELDERGHSYYRKHDEIELQIIKKYYSKLEMNELMKLKETFIKLKQIVLQEQRS
ncbi:MarR family transcriptional regulator [Gorillibacterium massiliense]|uniref:MarR family transcriptional regulator n=1 Tax=Gorillibacterium massiliense TaxID=1280390 RepID=UPI0004B54DF7|nr:MarR family transcriptional regulator [Gorillibacterium massiliense]